MSQDLLVEASRLATRWAEDAGRVAIPLIGQRPSGRKADDSMVTATDYLIQAQIVAGIQAAFPDHAVIGEEGGVQGIAKGPRSRYTWVIDPIDGTRNFVAGFPCFATSIALLDEGRPVVGVVRDHGLGHLYVARSGAGATRNGTTMNVREPWSGEDWLVGGPSSKDRVTTAVLERWIHTPGLIFRNVGSSAVHLSWVACGALAGAFAYRCKVWDIAAGMLLVSEAGGRITDLSGGAIEPIDLGRDPELDLPFVAGSPSVHVRLLQLVQEAVRDLPPVTVGAVRGA